MIINRIFSKLIKLTKFNFKRDLKTIYSIIIDKNIDSWHKRSFLFFLTYKQYLRKYILEKDSNNLIIDIGCGIAEIHQNHKYKLLLIDISYSCLRAASRILGANHDSIICNFFDDNNIMSFRVDNPGGITLLAINILHNQPRNIKKIIQFSLLNRVEEIIFDVPLDKELSDYLKFINPTCKIKKLFDDKDRIIYKLNFK